MGMAGPERAVCYRVAMDTGLRADELRSLTAGSFDLADLDNATIKVLAGYSKHKRDDILPIRRDLAECVVDFIADSRKLPKARLFNLPEKPADMIRADLERARQAWIGEASNLAENEKRERSDFLRGEDSEGAVVDFHGTRHTFVSRMVRSGVSPKVAQTLARHSTITLTMDRYTHILNADQRAALNQLPTIEPERKNNMLAATGGTDDAQGGEKSGALFGAHSIVSSGENVSTSEHMATTENPGQAENQDNDITARNSPFGPFCTNGGSSDHNEKPDWARKDSNLRPGDYESPALTN